MIRQSMAVRGRPGVGRTGAGDGKHEALWRADLTSSVPHPVNPTHARPTRRRCPQCRLTAPAGEFSPIRRVFIGAGARAGAWRTCPRCGHIATLSAFARVDGDGQRVGVGRAVRR